MSNKQLEVQIMGQSYLLGCPEGGEARLLAAVDKVDQAMCKVRDAGKIKARDRIAVLAALNLAFEQTESASSAEPIPSPSKAQAESFSDSDNDRLGQLLKKLDQALHQDGQLI
ncbi:MAG: cell division protein ZapA [Betaproteobacteria bacterium]|nr:cell division protein ZapA [Betaproteobacteria bacterium]